MYINLSACIYAQNYVYLLQEMRWGTLGWFDLVGSTAAAAPLDSYLTSMTSYALRSAVRTLHFRLIRLMLPGKVFDMDISVHTLSGFMTASSWMFIPPFLFQNAGSSCGEYGEEFLRRHRIFQGLLRLESFIFYFELIIFVKVNKHECYMVMVGAVSFRLTLYHWLYCFLPDVGECIRTRV